MTKKFACVALMLLLAVTVGAFQEESEPNSSRGLADGPISFNEVIKGYLPGVYGDTSPYDDYWSFSATAGNTYTFTAEPKNTSFLYHLDIDLELQNSSGGFIKESRVGGDDENEILTWTCTSSGTYYLDIYEGTGISNPASWYECNCEESTGVEDWELY